MSFLKIFSKKETIPTFRLKNTFTYYNQNWLLIDEVLCFVYITSKID